jgi:lipopolysaccharide transport system permease protein
MNSVALKQALSERAPQATSSHAVPIFDILPRRGWAELNLRELWEYRELLYILAWRDVKVRYKQTAIGAAWAILQPLLTMALFSVLFGRFAGLPSGGVPYPLFVFAALLPWQLFARALSDSSISLVANQSLISKVYFPRLMIPLSAVLAGLVDFGITLLLLFGIMLFYGIVPTLAILMLPLFLLLAIAAALAVGLWLSALNVQYRDVMYAIPFLAQFWFFATPIAYSSSIVPERWRLLFGLNPMTGVVEGFRWALLGTEAPSSLLLVSAAVVVVLLVGGLIYFRRMEDSFADVI